MCHPGLDPGSSNNINRLHVLDLVLMPVPCGNSAGVTILRTFYRFINNIFQV